MRYTDGGVFFEKYLDSTTVIGFIICSSITERGMKNGKEFNHRQRVQNIVWFSLPYLLSYFLQTLYGMADLFIIGQFTGVAATTAVSVGSQVMHMLTVIIVGLAMGATVSIRQAVGGGDLARAAAATGNTVTLFMALSVVLTGALLALVQPIVAVMSTPAEAAAGTADYLRVCFIGVPFITAYNIISAIFRGMGDSKSPMVFIAIACAANIGLDYLFMGALCMGPIGAALGTTLSQAISMAAALAAVRRHHVIAVNGPIFGHNARQWGAFCASACRLRSRTGLFRFRLF